MTTQGTAQWFADRCGCVTASRVADILAKTKTGPAASRQSYLAQLVAERLTGVVEPTYASSAMQWGTETEPIARAAYEIKTGELVEQVGFVPHPDIAFSGASPDGLIGDVGMVEIKCPNTATHIDYLLSGVVPVKYKPQMTWQVACAKRDWVDFVSYDPRMPDEMKLFITRFQPSQEEISELERQVMHFLIEVDTTISQLKRKVA